MALELAQAVARHRARVRRGLGRSHRLSLQLERPADALDVHADHAGALALAAERGDREPRHVAHLAVGPASNGFANALAKVIQVEVLAAPEALLP